MENCWKLIFAAAGGALGWIVGEFRPTFPLILAATAFIFYDALTAFWLDKRVKRAYPDKTTRNEAKFTSFAFGKVVRSTLPRRLALIILAFIAEKWVFVFMTTHLSYVATGVIFFEQMWSVLENESSCRPENEGRMWKLLQKVMVDKTARHFDVNLDELKKEKS